MTLLIRYKCHLLPVELKESEWSLAYEAAAGILGVEAGSIAFHIDGLPVIEDSPVPRSSQADLVASVIDITYGSALYHKTMYRARKYATKHRTPDELAGGKRPKYSRKQAMHDITSTVTATTAGVHHHLDGMEGTLTERLNGIAASLQSLERPKAIGSEGPQAEGPHAIGSEGPQAIGSEGPQAEGPQAIGSEGPQAIGSEGPHAIDSLDPRMQFAAAAVAAGHTVHIEPLGNAADGGADDKADNDDGPSADDEADESGADTAGEESTSDSDNSDSDDGSDGSKAADGSKFSHFLKAARSDNDSSDKDSIKRIEPAPTNENEGIGAAEDAIGLLHAEDEKHAEIAANLDGIGQAPTEAFRNFAGRWFGWHRHNPMSPYMFEKMEGYRQKHMYAKLFLMHAEMERELGKAMAERDIARAESQALQNRLGCGT